MPADDRDDRGANHADHDDEWLRVHELPERIRRRLRRLVVRCPHDEPVLTVYQVPDGRLLVTTAASDPVWRSVAGRHGRASWLEYIAVMAGAESVGDELSVRCRRGLYRLSVARVVAAVPPTGMRNAGVSELAPPTAMP